MINSDMYGEIRRRKNAGESQRKVARDLGLSRGTVAKYWRGERIPGVNEPGEPAEDAGKAAVKTAMRGYYDNHMDDQANKQRINAKTLWRDLHYQYPRSKATYRRYWAEIRGERQVRTRLPLTFGMAEAAQADWKIAKVRLRGEEFKAHVLCVNLMYGYTPFMKAYPNEKQYNLIDGLVSAYAFFGGACRKLLIDNMTAARKKGYGKDAEMTGEFKLFAAHYGIEVVFMNPGEPEEKGGVEDAAKAAGGILTPVMDVSDISEVNDRLLLECAQYIEHAGRVGNRPATVKEMTEEERPSLIPLPIKRYEVGIHDKAAVSNQQMFKYDGFTYSVPRPYAGKEIGIVAHAFRVAMYCNGRKIWGCTRPVLDGENRVFAEHYLYDLDIKPRSRENAFPLLYGVLPPELHRFRELCQSKTTKCSQLYMLMKLMVDVGRERLLKAVDIVNAEGGPTYERVAAILGAGTGPGCCGGGASEPGQACPDDDFYVEQRDLSDYAAYWGASDRRGWHRRARRGKGP